MNNYKRYTLKDTLESEQRALFNVLSTFAGGGGSSTGYRLAGGKILAINEFVPEAQNTYRENYPDTLIIPGDIKKLTGKDFLEKINLKPGEIEGVENVEDLFFEFLRVAEEIKPKVIIGENVEGLTMGEAKEYFHRIQNTFEQIGYLIVANVLNSSYYGVPQARKRTFFIAVREDVAEKVGINFMTMYQLYPEANKDQTTLGEAINDVVNEDQEEINLLLEKLGPETAVGKTLAKMPKDPDKVLTGMDYHDKGHHFNLKRCSLRKPSPTITAMGNYPGVAGTCHPLEDRKFTITELKRIMSLPEDFKLTGEHKQRSERIGRMVPPLMMKALAESVYNKVLKPYKELDND